MTIVQQPFDQLAELPVSSETLAYFVLKARAFDTQVDTVDPDEGSNAADDRFIDALEDGRDNPAARELRAAISSLDSEAQAALVALAWIGREDFEPEEWKDALAAAVQRHEGPTWRYLMGIPLIGDYVEEGAAKLGINITSDETAGLHHPAIEGDDADEDRD